MRLVEIVRGLKTSMETVLTAEKIIHSMKKETVRVKDVPGFLVNRINQPQERSLQLPHGGLASVEDIDKAAPAGPRHPWGLRSRRHGRTRYRARGAEGLFNSYKDIKWRPSMLLEQLVESGDLGRNPVRMVRLHLSEKKPGRCEVLIEGEDIHGLHHASS